MSRRRKAFALFATFLIVLSAVPSGTAGQSITGDECDPSIVDYGVALMSPATAAYNYATSDGCAVDEVLQGNKEQEAQDIHANAETLNASTRSFTNAQHNALENARTIAWTQAEVATLKALENNSSISETRVAAREAVRDYYSRLLHNIVQDRNAKWQEIGYLYQTRENESLGVENFTFTWGAGEEHITNTTVAPRDTVTLPNGSTVEVVAMYGHEDSRVGDPDYNYNFDGPLWHDGELTYDGSTTNPGQITVTSTYDNETVVAYNSSMYWALMQEARAQNQQMLDNMNSTVNGLYGSYVRGELDIEEYRSVQAAAMGWGQDLDETGYSTYAVVALAQAGEQVPDLNATGSMTIETPYYANGTNETLTGLVVGEPTDGSSSWQVGQTYDPDNSNGTVTFHVSGTNESIELDRPFTLVGAEGSEGQEISTVETQQYNYRTSNFSELGDKLDLLIELRQEEQERIEEASNGDSGGGIAWPDFGAGAGLALGGGVVMLAIVAVLVGIGVKLYFEVMTP